jgi:hypothetical protein
VEAVSCAVDADEKVVALLRAGADPRALDDGGRTALERARERRAEADAWEGDFVVGFRAALDRAVVALEAAG